MTAYAILNSWPVNLAESIALVVLGRQAIIDWTRYLRAKWEEGNDDY